MGRPVCLIAILCGVLATVTAEPYVLLKIMVTIALVTIAITITIIKV